VPYSAILAVVRFDGNNLGPRGVGGESLGSKILRGADPGDVIPPPDPWFVGPVGWYLRDVVAMPRPVACRGAPGLWLVEGGLLAQVREGYRLAKAA
jgi:hypothetical protein